MLLRTKAILRSIPVFLLPGIFLMLMYGYKPEQGSFTAMTYNIRLAWPKEGPTSWAERKEGLINQLNFYSPDVLGMQEVLKEQLDDIEAGLPGYDFTGVGRDDGKTAGEYSPVFFKKDRFKLVRENTFWLSPDPDKPSKGWDAAYNRVCTYALLEDKVSQQKFWVFNTHFDHVGETAREKSVHLIDSMVKTLNIDNFPVVLMGDLNLEPDKKPIRFLSSRYNDAKKISRQKPFGPEGTFNNFEFSMPVTRRIDYIFTSKENITVEKYAVLSDSKDLHYYSDHLPVMVKLHFNSGT